MLKKYFCKAYTIQILSITLLLSIIAYQYISLKHESNAVRFQQTDKFSYSLTNIAATEASRYLSEERNNELQFLIDSLSQDPVVRDATIYDKYGKILYQSEQALALTTLLKIGGDSKDAEGVLPYIAELYANKTKIGYIRITLEQEDILSLIQEYEEHGLMTLQLLIMLSFIMGMLIMAFFFRKAEVKYKHFKMEFPFIMQGIKIRIQELIKKAQK